jgi:hypothetical protein
VESDDNSECIFSLSLSANNDASNGKPVSTHLLHNTDMPSKDIHDRVTSAKDTQSANASIKIASKDCHLWSKKFEPSDQAGDHKKKTRLWTIHEES